jgi:hypothetical protein
MAISSQAQNIGKVQRLERKLVDPSGSKCGAPLWGGDIVWPSSKDEEGRETSYLVRNIPDRGICKLQHDVHGYAATRPGTAYPLHRRFDGSHLTEYRQSLFTDTRGRRTVRAYPFDQAEKIIERQLTLKSVAFTAAWNHVAANVALAGVNAINAGITDFKRWQRNTLINTINLVFHAMNIRWLRAAIAAWKHRDNFQLSQGKVTVPPAPLNLRVKISPNRFYIALTRLAAARWTTPTLKLAIRPHSFSPAPTPHKASPVRLAGKRLIKIVFDDDPPTVLLPNRGEGIGMQFQFRTMRTAVHAYLSRQVFHLALHG